MNMLTSLASSIPPAQRTLPLLLQRQAQRYGDRPLFAAGDMRHSFADALRMAQTCGASLLAAGVRAGDRVALLCSNRAEFLQTLLGCAWIGAVTVPINTASRGVQLRHILANSGARLLVTESEGLQAVQALAALGPGETALEAIWLVGDAPPSDLPPACTPFPTGG
jgi:crotonobetaine/carnitine-CoA ligase